MLLLCAYYCIPAFKFLYFAAGPRILLCARFALKRGTRNQRRGLRLAAFIMMFFGSLKFFIIDVPMIKVDIREYACGLYKMPFLDCGLDTSQSLKIIQFASLIAFAIVSVILMHYYKVCMPDSKPKDTTPQQVHLRFYANLAFNSILFLVAWQLAPWVGYLTVGCIPKIFESLKWQEIAIANLVLLVIGFWKLESCVWQYKVSEKERMKHMQSNWTPKDTLWTSVFMYILTMGLGYASHDIMTRSHTVGYSCTKGEARRSNEENNTIDTGNYQIQQYQ